MEDLSSCINVIIKATDQADKDHTVQCHLHWTVKELKEHLSEVYPNKPHPGIQKLIYSGCLLPDEAVVSEVLRSYEGLKNNTVHLVCSSSKEGSNKSNSLSMKREKIAPCTSADIPTPRTMGDPHQDLRRRIPYVNIVNGWRRVPYSNGWTPHEGYDHEHMYQQMIWVQQAYMQYMSHYLQMTNINNVPNQQHSEPQNQQENAAAPQNRAEEEAEEDGHLHRDWLDWVYIFSRVAVLFSVVYFYSSPIRCIMVTTMALLLYHLGMLRWRPVINNNNMDNNFNNRVEVGEEAQEENVVEQHEPVVELQNPNWLSISWTFLSSFVLSLIPDQREA